MRGVSCGDLALLLGAGAGGQLICIGQWVMHFMENAFMDMHSSAHIGGKIFNVPA